jgi:CheY-like chemotaxis protein
VIGQDYGPQVDRLPTILIVDGDDDTRLLYRTILEPVAGSILEAEDGEAALATAIDTRPDFVITETRLRNLDGYTLCERLRDDPHTRQALRLVVTGSTRSTDLVHATQSGADRLLIKPCTPEDLRAAVLQMWSRRPDAVEGRV